MLSSASLLLPIWSDNWKTNWKYDYFYQTYKTEGSIGRIIIVRIHTCFFLQYFRTRVLIIKLEICGTQILDSYSQFSFVAHLLLWKNYVSTMLPSLFKHCTATQLPWWHFKLHNRPPHFSRHAMKDDASASEIFFYYKKNIFFIVKKWHAKISLHHLHTFILDSYKLTFFFQNKFFCQFSLKNSL